jgi:hypothetical protein
MHLHTAITWIATAYDGFIYDILADGLPVHILVIIYIDNGNAKEFFFCCE